MTAHDPSSHDVVDRAAVLTRYRTVRRRTEALAAWLSAEDQLLQAFADASPTKWHRAHTTWFFETFVVVPAGLPVHDPAGAYLWNSYYDAVGARHPRPERGLLSRPSLAEVAAYRRAVDDRVASLIETADPPALARLAAIIALGCAHEEQHQELILTDTLAGFARSPVGPRLRPAEVGAPPGPTPGPTPPLTFTGFDGGLTEIGRDLDRAAPLTGFVFDNEGPRHKVWLAPFELADRLITVGEVRGFVADGGYRTPSLWLSAGLAWVQAHGLTEPGYVRVDGDAWLGFSADGWRPLADDEPAAWLSLYEADAVARWLGGRLPTEAEWEHAATTTGFAAGNFLDDPATSALRPRPAAGPGPGQFAGHAWEWTSSAYAAYPGFEVSAGALGEYNGKFMCGQYVLRGGSAFTPAGHARPSYRNFWPAETRFQLSGARVARDRR